MAGQYLGAFLAALVLWGEYADVIKLAEATQVSSKCEVKLVIERWRKKNPNHQISNFSPPRTLRHTVGLPLASLDLTLPSPQKRSHPEKVSKKFKSQNQGDNSEPGDGPDAGHGPAPPHHPRGDRRGEHEDHLQPRPGHHRTWPQRNSPEVNFDYLSGIFPTKTRRKTEEIY